jgi:hypothetical protein
MIMDRLTARAYNQAYPGCALSACRHDIRIEHRKIVRAKVEGRPTRALERRLSRLLRVEKVLKDEEALLDWTIVNT